MPRDYSKRPRAGDGPKRNGYKPGAFSKKPWEPREHHGERRESGGVRRDFHPPRYDEELFAARGKVADIAGPAPQSRFEILHKLWDFFRAEELIVPAGYHPRPNAEEWRHRGGDSHYDEPQARPPKRAHRKPAGEHPSARKVRSLEGVPRRKFKQTRGE